MTTGTPNPMTVSPFDSAIFGRLYSDPELLPLFGGDAVIDAMVEVEVALAKVQGGLGIIPAKAAREIAKAGASFQPDFEAIAEGTKSSGVAVIALVDQLRSAAGDAGQYVHWGATSQDIIDTGLVLRLKKALDIINRRTGVAAQTLAHLTGTHRQTIMCGRTRSQQALPVTFGLKAAGWLDALLDSRTSFDELLPRLLKVQFGGAAGTLAALGDAGIAVSDGLARELELQAASAPWHTNRTSFVQFASHLCVTTGVLGKIGQDIILLSQSEVGEVRQGDGGGGSSTMPQKSNPVIAETLVALARMNAGLLGTMAQAQIQEHERGGPGWQLEDLTLPQMVVACGAALQHTQNMLSELVVDKKRMRQNLDASGGLILAEAATFALAEKIGRADAQALVKKTLAEALSSSQNLIDLLETKTDAPIDWAALANPANYLGVSDALISRVLEKHGKTKT